MERLSKANRIQEKIGSCMGCPAQTSAVEGLKGIATGQRLMELKKISRELCPEGNIMQMPTIQRSSVW